MAKVKGFVIFVPGAKQGERVKIKINKVLRKVGFAEVVGKATSEKEEGSEMSEESKETSENSVEEDQSYESEDSEEFGEET